MSSTCPSAERPVRRTKKVLASLVLPLLFSGCSLLGIAARAALDGDGGSPSSDGAAPAAGATGTSAEAAAADAGKALFRARRSGGKTRVTSAFLWGPSPPSVPEGAIAISTIGGRISGDIGRVGAQPLRRRYVPGGSLLTPWAVGGREVTPLGPSGPSFAVRALFMAGGTPIGLAPAWWHATPWLSGWSDQPFPGTAAFWLVADIPARRFFPGLAYPVYLR